MPTIPSFLDLYPDEQSQVRRGTRAPRISPEQAAERLRQLGASTTTSVPPAAQPAAASGAAPGVLQRVGGVAGKVLRVGGPVGLATTALGAVAANAGERSLLRSPTAFLEDLQGAVPESVSGPARALTQRVLGDDPLGALRRFFGGSRTPAQSGRGAVPLGPNDGPQISPEALAFRQLEGRLAAQPAGGRDSGQAAGLAGPISADLQKQVDDFVARGGLTVPDAQGRPAINPTLRVGRGLGVVVNNQTGRAAVVGQSEAPLQAAPAGDGLPPVPVIDTPYDKAGINSAIQYVAARQQQAVQRRQQEQELLRNTQLGVAVLGAQGRTEAATIGGQARIDAARITAGPKPKTELVPGIGNTPSQVVSIDPTTGVGTARNVVQAPPAGVTLGDIAANADRAVAAGDSLDQVNSILKKYGLPERRKAQ